MLTLKTNLATYFQILSTRSTFLSC